MRYRRTYVPNNMKLYLLHNSVEIKLCSMLIYSSKHVQSLVQFHASSDLLAAFTHFVSNLCTIGNLDCRPDKLVLLTFFHVVLKFYR